MSWMPDDEADVMVAMLPRGGGWPGEAGLRFGLARRALRTFAILISHDDFPGLEAAHL